MNAKSKVLPKLLIVLPMLGLMFAAWECYQVHELIQKARPIDTREVSNAIPCDQSVALQLRTGHSDVAVIDGEKCAFAVNKKRYYKTRDRYLDAPLVLTGLSGKSTFECIGLEPHYMDRVENAGSTYYVLPADSPVTVIAKVSPIADGKYMLKPLQFCKIVPDGWLIISGRSLVEIQRTENEEFNTRTLGFSFLGAVFLFLLLYAPPEVNRPGHHFSATRTYEIADVGDSALSRRLTRLKQGIDEPLFPGRR
jgi:hypothetical protein